MSVRRPALIFDFGNVVAFFDYTRACEKFGPRLGLSGEDFLRHLRDRGLTPVLQDYERGSITSEHFSRAVGELAGLDFDHDEFSTAWADIFWLNKPVATLICALRAQGYALVLGSNTNDLHATQFRKQFAETLSQFDRLVLSYEVGHIKPSAEFYQACALAAAASPRDCVFIDDMPENVEGARSAGLTGLLYRDASTLIRDLAQLGVEFDTAAG